MRRCWGKISQDCLLFDGGRKDPVKIDLRSFKNFANLSLDVLLTSFAFLISGIEFRTVYQIIYERQQQIFSIFAQIIFHHGRDQHQQ